MEPYDGAAPSPSAWKADIPAAIRIRQVSNLDDYDVWFCVYI